MDGMKLVAIIALTQIKRLLGIKSPSMEFLRIYGPIIRNEMDSYMAYAERIIEMLKSEDDTTKRL